MTHVTCWLTAKNRDQLWNPTLGNRVWATFLDQGSGRAAGASIEWDGLDQRVTDTVIKHTVHVLYACTAADERHLEHALLTLRTFAEMQLITI